MNDIFINSIIEWRDIDFKIVNVERVLWISQDCSSVAVIDICSEGSLPTYRIYTELVEALNTPYVKKLQDDPYTKFFRAHEQIDLKHQKHRDLAWEIISGIVSREPEIYDKRKRGKLVAEVCEKKGVHKKVVYAYLKRYWIRGKTKNCLLPEFDRCGAPGKERTYGENVKPGRPREVAKADPALKGVKVTENDKKNIKNAVDNWYDNPKENTLKFAYEEMKSAFYNTGFQMIDGDLCPILPPDESIISFDQFKYWAHKYLETKESLIKRVGKKTYALKNRGISGNATERAFGPGAVFEIDATPANVYLVSIFDRRRIIGRPVVYIVKDVFSRLVAGMYVGLEGPSWLGAMMALENATTDKVSFCAQYGINISEDDWPCHFLPASVTADRGELKSHNTDNLTESLGVRFDNTPPYRADLKGIVEQHFDLLDEKLKPWIPGEIRKEIRERGEPDYRLGARMTIYAFTRCVIYAILEHNMKELKNYKLTEDMTIDRVPPIPIELWNWGIVNLSGWLQEKSRDIIRLNLMPSKEASVTPQGIYFKQMHYSCDVAIQEKWYEKARKNGRYSINVSYDMRNCKYIYIRTNNGTEFIKCQLLGQYERFYDKRFEEVEDQLFEEKVGTQQRKTEQNQNTAYYNTKIKNVMEDEIEKTEAALDPEQSKASRTKNIRENRKEERDHLREKEEWELGADNETSLRNADIIPFSDVKQNDSAENLDEKPTEHIVNILKSQQEERRNKK